VAGDRLAKELRKIRSDIPIIFSAGYSEIMTKEKVKSLGIKGVLMKPVTLRKLSNIVHNVLNDFEDAGSG
jgi:DNA-binding NarL/FixJ family response regulator